MTRPLPWNPSASERLEVLLRCAVPNLGTERIRQIAERRGAEFSLVLHNYPGHAWASLLERAMQGKGLPPRERQQFRGVLGRIIKNGGPRRG